MTCYPVREITHYCNISVPACSHMIPHKIDFYDLTFVLSGSMTYISDGKTYTLGKNDALLLPPGSFCSRLAGTEPTHYVSFNFHPSSEASLDFDIFMPKCISSDIRKLVSVFPQSHLSPYYHSKEKVANMLGYILFELADITAARSSNGYVLKITNYIEAHITERLSLDIISREVNLSREYTCAIFKKETGKTLINYINERKMLLAKELIQNREMSLSSISVYLGYDNYNYFSRLFRKHFDVTPISIKKK